MLDERQLKVCELLSQGMPITEISKNVGVSRQTIYTWKEMEEFKAELDKLGQEYISSAQGRLKNAAKDAADMLIDLLKKGKYEKTRLAAAADILDRSLGKATTKIDINNNKADGKKVNDDILENEFNEIDSNEVE